MDSVAYYSYATMAWNTAQGVPLVVWPHFICSLLRVEPQHIAPLEEYFSRSLGMALIALGLTTVVLTGAIPLTSVPISETEPVSPYATAIIFLTTLHHAASSFYAYTRYTTSDQTAFVAGSLGSGLLAVVGLFNLLFAGDKTRRSKKHGFDKDTSSFPFKNKESYRDKKSRVKEL